MPPEIQQGVPYLENSTFFPEEFKVLYDDLNEDLIPIVQSVKRTKKTKNTPNQQIK
jgi:hypothetical protein